MQKPVDCNGMFVIYPRAKVHKVRSGNRMFLLAVVQFERGSDISGIFEVKTVLGMELKVEH